MVTATGGIRRGLLLVTTVIAPGVDTLPDPRKAGGHPSLKGRGKQPSNGYTGGNCDSPYEGGGTSFS